MIVDYFLEDDTAAMHYQSELEFLQWYSEVGFIECINAELQEIASEDIAERSELYITL